MGELLSQMDSLEWSMWEALATSDPFGEDRADWRAGLLASTAVNVAAAKDISSAKDLLLKFQDPDAEKLDVETRIRGGFARIMAAQKAGK